MPAATSASRAGRTSPSEATPHARGVHRDVGVRGRSPRHGRERSHPQRSMHADMAARGDAPQARRPRRRSTDDAVGSLPAPVPANVSEPAAAARDADTVLRAERLARTGARPARRRASRSRQSARAQAMSLSFQPIRAFRKRCDRRCTSVGDAGARDLARDEAAAETRAARGSRACAPRRRPRRRSWGRPRRKPRRLRGARGRCTVRRAGGHLGEDEVRRAVEHAADLEDLLARERLRDRAHDRDRAADRGLRMRWSRRCEAASARNSGPRVASRSLFAVTTCLPDSSAATTSSAATPVAADALDRRRRSPGRATSARASSVKSDGGHLSAGRGFVERADRRCPASQ